LALVLLIMVTLPIANLLGAVVRQTSYNRTSVAAGEVAESILTNAPAQLSLWMNGQWPNAGAPTVPSGCTTKQLACTLPQAATTHAGITYTASLELSWALISNLNKNVCTSGQVPQVVNATALVSWNHGSTFSEETNVQLPYIPSNSNDGYLAVQVNGATNQAQPNIEMTYTSTSPGSAPQRVPTDQYGCAFVEVPQGNYTISLGPPTGSTSIYVDDQEVVTPTDSNVAIPALAITQEQFNYDQAATVTLHYPSVTAGEDGAFCPSSQLCYVSGQGAGGATVYATSSGGSSWNIVGTPGIARLHSVVCPQTTTCFGIGSTDAVPGSPQATILTFTESGNLWSATSAAPALPAGATGAGLTSLSCPAAGQCFASGYTVSGSAPAAAQSGWLLSYNGSTWATVATSGSTDIPSIACPTPQTCLLVNDNGSASGVDTFTTASSTFSAQSLSPSPTTVTAVTCPLAASTSGAPCFVQGISGGAPTYYVTADSGAHWVAFALPAGTDVVSPPVCTSTTACLVAGANGTSTTSTAVIEDLTGTPPPPPPPPAPTPPLVWSASPATLGGSLASVSLLGAISCPSSTQCVASGQGTSGGSPTGVLAQSTDGGATWNLVTVPSPPSGKSAPGFMTGVACSAVGTCIAGAESADRTILYVATGGTWSESTFDPGTAAAGGVVAQGLSITVGNPGLTGSGTKVMVPSTAGTNPVSIGSLYPYPNGYNVWPGNCSSQAFGTLPITPAVVGAANTADLQFGYLPLRVVNSSTGQPIPGALVSITELATTGTGCGTDTYTLPDTGGSGLSEAGVPLGNYTLVVHNPLDGAATTEAVSVSPSGVSAAATTANFPALLTVQAN